MGRGRGARKGGSSQSRSICPRPSGGFRRISLQGDSATLSLQAAPAAALARWLSQARDNAQALPTQAQLQQINTAKTDSPEVTWRGSLVLRLPSNP